MTVYHGFMVPFDLDINLLRCFEQVAETGSFTGAGKRIGLTQSGVSVKIRRLEDRLGKPLFDRAGKTVTLTLEGELLLNDARRLLSLHDETVSRFMTPNAAGKLRVGLIDYFLPELLPSLLCRFSRQYPNIHLKVQTDVGMNLIPLYEKGELDLVVAGRDAYPGPCRVLTREPLVWVVGKEAEIDSSRAIPLVLLPSPCSFRRIAIKGLDGIGRKWEVMFTGTSIANIQAAVQAGMGISILPQGAVKEGLKTAPSHLGLPELPMYAIVLVADENKAGGARDVFIRYLEAELDLRVASRTAGA